MKTDTIIVLAAAALGVYAVYRLTARRATAGPASTLNRGGSPSTAALQAQWNNGAGGWGTGYFDQGI